MTRLARTLGAAGYHDLHRISVEDPERFWPAVVADLGLEFSQPWEHVVDVSRGPEWATWFVGGRVNAARACVHRWAAERPDGEALVGLYEDGGREALTWAEAARAVTQLAEALAESQRVAFEAKDSLDRLLRRAAAAKLLYDTLLAEREAMRKAYVAPLREGIERLGRHVFGPTLRVEVDDNLQVVSRTLDGVTVSLVQLSTGAREQMGLLVRLAAASMVSKDGGVPLVLDDALGSTDEGRLESMGAVLRIASQDIQTIILTCAPERYFHVGAQVSTAM